MAVFGALAKKGKEPSAPRKIGLGMLIAAAGFVIMAVASVGQPNPTALSAGAEANLVSPNWLISTYLVLTFGELLLSPMGISFVTKVAPPKYKGLMMGGWFAATAIGNYLTVIGPTLWDKNIPLWVLWAVMIGVCLVSFIFIFSIMKKLEAVAK
jgi:POT family proton-dependent oligopeptide transporter